MRFRKSDRNSSLLNQRDQIKVVENLAASLAGSSYPIMECAVKILKETYIQSLLSGSLPRGRMEKSGIIRMGLVNTNTVHSPLGIRTRGSAGSVWVLTALSLARDSSATTSEEPTKKTWSGSS